MRYSMANLRRWVSKWQKILRLQDWDICVVRVTKWEKGELRAAEMRPSNEHQVSTLAIMTMPALRKAGEIRPVEQIIIHEMLHLYFWTLDVNEYERVRNEQGINQVSYLLFKAHGDEVKP